MRVDDFLNLSIDEINQAVDNKIAGNDLANEVINLENDIKDLNDKLDAAKKEIEIWVEDYNKGVTGNLKERVENLKNNYNSIFSELNKKVQEYEEKKKDLDKIQNQQKWEERKEKAAEVIDKFKINKKDGIKEVKRIIKKAKKKTRIKLSEKLKNWVIQDLKRGVVYKTAQKVKTGVPNLVQGAKEKGQAALDWAKEDLKKGVVYNAAQELNEVGKNLPGVVQQVKDAVPEVKNIVAEKGQAALDWAKEDLKKGVVYNAAQKIKDTAPELVQGAKEKGQAALDWAKEDLKKGVVYNAAQELNEVGKNLPGVVQQVKDAVPEVKNIVAEKGQAALDWAKEDLKKGVVYNAAQKIKDTAPELVQGAKEKGQAALDWAKEDLKKGVVYNAAQELNEVGKNLPGVVQQVKDAVPEVKDIVAEKGQVVVAGGAMVVDVAKSAIAKTAKGLVSEIKGNINKAANYVEGKGNVIKAKGERFGNFLGEAARENGTRLNNHLEVMRQEIDAFKEIRKRAKEARKAIEDNHLERMDKVRKAL